ncbi:MucB/RseB C-terminal domain-containing protein [Alteromonas gilva]|uniref:MucB/RseB C-terminal domain-containing protein n=1 Tax=Alteromonas gilva TaxID=2987522 RepID=A0ABT5L888_9ALTE|nr:MucB/RseB C-terminal domain-containing protein [Alteromonas gilva]MDC8832751.1 MucB/RseB C-terminal domain-containing protein [Alteromonas gilva]
MRFLKQRTALAVRLLFVAGLSLGNQALALPQQSATDSELPVPSDASPDNESESNGIDQVERLSLNGLEWLERLAQANRQSNFEVSFVLTRPGQEVIPYLWRHALLENGLEAEQLNLQNGPGQEMIRLGNVVSVFEPDVQPYSIYADAITGPLPSDLLYEPQALVDAYQFITIGRTRVSGRPAQQLRIVSRDNKRYNYQLWLDEETGMLLKLNMVDLQGALLEQVQVTGIKVSPEPAPYFAKINPQALPSAVAMTPKTRQHQWEVQFIPVGMQEIKRETRRLAMTGQVVEYKLFSDGMVDVSVYVQPAHDSLDSDVVLRHSTNTFLSLTTGQIQITVIGKVPPATAYEIAHSLRAVGT